MGKRGGAFSIHFPLCCTISQSQIDHDLFSLIFPIKFRRFIGHRLIKINARTIKRKREREKKKKKKKGQGNRYHAGEGDTLVT